MRKREREREKKSREEKRRAEESRAECKVPAEACAGRISYIKLNSVAMELLAIELAASTRPRHKTVWLRSHRKTEDEL